MFITTEYVGYPQKTLDHIAEWIDINELLQKDKIFTEIYLLDKYHKMDLFNKTNFKLHFIVDTNHKLIDEKCVNISYLC